MNVRLARLARNPEGAPGVLLLNGWPVILTLEHTYDPNNSVKIPPGRWQCKRSYYWKGKYETFEIIVPGHSRLLFHAGNVEDDADGCILTGFKFSGPGRMEATSRAAHLQLMLELIGVNEFELEVVEA